MPHQYPSTREHDMTAAPIEQPALVERPDALPPRPRRILVAEDEHLVATDLTMMLADLGYTTMVAGDAKEAAKLAKPGRPALALRDIRMPTRDGLSAARRAGT